MARTVKHLSVHRVDGTELRVVSDVGAGTLLVIQAEEDVIRQYSAAALWPHRWVTLFVLKDMQPLARQLGARAGAAEMLSSLPPGGIDALAARPIVSAYDLASSHSCNLFVNQEAMLRAGYWEDPLALRGLLAHEHAHPLAENETTRASRRLLTEISLLRPQYGHEDATQSAMQAQIARQLVLLADELCLYAPREIAANELALRSGFGEHLFHLAQRNLAAARGALAGRAELRSRLQRERSEARLAPRWANGLLLLADLRGHANWAFELAPFYHSGYESIAQELEAALQADVFSHLEPQVSALYATLREQYQALRPDLAADELLSWGRHLLQGLAEIMAEGAIETRLDLRLAQEVQSGDKHG
jgi:hypothetical protein